MRSWAIFEDPVRSALHRLKYRRDISLGNSLAFMMLPYVRSLKWPIDLIIPIPLGRLRRIERGYNQAGMIAMPLSLALGVAYAPNDLIRQKETRSQVGLSRSARKENVSGAFHASGKVRGRTILLLDDVATTGATLSSASMSLISAGARDVYALTVARALRLEHA